MARVIFVEVLDHRGRVRSRTRLTTFPASIGRAYTNDVILDDTYVDANHAHLIEADGRLEVVDAGSINGLRAATAPGTGARGRVPRLAVDGGTQCVLGRTTLRFVDPDAPVPPTVAETVEEDSPLGRIGRPRWALSLAVLTVGLVTVSEYLGATDRTTVAGLFNNSLAILAVVVLWSGSWALAGRLLSHRPHFLGHLGVACAALLAVRLWSEGSAWAGFILSRETSFSVGGGLVLTAVFIFALQAHLTLATAMTRRARWRGAVGVAVGVFGLVVLSALSTRDSSPDRMEFPSELKPVPVRWLSTRTPAQFTAGVRDLRRQVDDLAAASP